MQLTRLRLAALSSTDVGLANVRWMRCGVAPSGKSLGVMYDCDDDEHIAERILWKAAKHNLPAAETFLFAGMPGSICSAIREEVATHDVGDPLLVFGSKLDRWTVVGTRGAVSNHLGTISHFHHADVRGFEWADPEGIKRCYQLMEVSLTDGTRAHAWGPPVNQAFALQGILLMLSRMGLCKPGESHR